MDKKTILWTTPRVERVLNGIAELRERGSSKKVVDLQRENERLRADLSELEQVHRTAMKDLSEKGKKMEGLMRQLLGERVRLTEELALMRKEKEHHSKKDNSKACMTDMILRSEVSVQTDANYFLISTSEQATQTVKEREFTSSELVTSSVKMIGHTPLFPHVVEAPVRYSYTLEAATSVRYAKRAEHLALAIYAIGQWVENVKLDVRFSNFLFVGVSVDGWWQWHRQTTSQLNAVAGVLKAYRDDANPLWWCGALASALLDLDVDHIMTVGDFLVAGCGCDVGAQMTLNISSLKGLVEFLITGQKCCLMFMREDATVNRASALVLKVAVLENEALFYVVRSSGDAGEGDKSVVEGLECMLMGEWRSSQQLLGEFDAFQTVECRLCERRSDIRWPDVVKDHLTTVAVALPDNIFMTEHTVQARLLDVTTLLWWPIELIPRGGNAFVLFSPLLDSVASAVVVLNVDATAVYRLDFVRILPNGGLLPITKQVIITQVDGQEIYASSVVLNAAMERETPLEERRDDLHSAFLNLVPAVFTEHCVRTFGVVVDHWKACSDIFFGTASSIHLVDPYAVDGFLTIAQSTIAARLDVMMNYMDHVAQLVLPASLSLLFSSLHGPGGSRGVDLPLLTLLSTVARQNAELNTLRSRNTHVGTSLRNAAVQLNAANKQLALAEERNANLQTELGQCTLTCEGYRQESAAKEAQLAEAVRYCCAVEEQLRSATVVFRELYASLTELQREQCEKLLENAQIFYGKENGMNTL